YLTDATSSRHSPFQTAALVPAQWMLANSSSRADDRYVSVGGIIGESDDVIFLGPLTRVPTQPRDENDGDYTLVLLDASGGLLASTSVAVPPATEGRQHRSFSASVRWADSARSLALLRGTTVLARRDRTAHPPRIEVESTRSAD